MIALSNERTRFVFINLIFASKLLLRIVRARAKRAAAGPRIKCLGDASLAGGHMFLLGKMLNLQWSS